MSVIMLSKLERIVLCANLAQATNILKELSIDIDGPKFVKKYLTDFRKYRAIMEEHSPDREGNVSMGNNEENKG